ncbi:MAG TPA: D-alanyl-D-alanine carboxypeptidase, partial [Rhabdochlamydiaceae bacterium]|nr:D-alanyl-D-alanine carboxypeptidase [Rhabdochlamydiaceae bacterium]
MFCKFCVIFFSVFFFSIHAQQLKLNIAAKSAILINADTGMVLYEKNAHTPSYPASITKVATALYALEQKQDLDAPILATQDSLSVVPA